MDARQRKVRNVVDQPLNQNRRQGLLYEVFQIAAIEHQQRPALIIFVNSFCYPSSFNDSL
jgi:hypothetical protein